MRIDVHAHYYPPALYDMLDRVTGKPMHRMPREAPGMSRHISIEGQLELMDAAGIDRMVLSLGNTPPYYPEESIAADAARGSNDVYVALHTQHPQRFNAFIGLPLPHADAALAEIERGLALPGVVGVGLGCSVLGKPLDDPAFDPVFAELDRRRAVTFLHPVGAGGGPNSSDFSMTWMLASRFEDTIAMARLILSGLTLRYPNIRFIIPHLGGTLTLFLQRMDNVAGREGWLQKRGTDLMPSDLARRFWVDTVSEQPSALRCACETFGPDRVILGTDWPMLPPDKLKHFVDYIPESLSPEVAQRVLETNAGLLFGLT